MLILHNSALSQLFVIFGVGITGFLQSVVNVVALTLVVCYNNIKISASCRGASGGLNLVFKGFNGVFWRDLGTTRLPKTFTYC